MTLLTNNLSLYTFIILLTSLFSFTVYNTFKSFVYKK